MIFLLAIVVVVAAVVAGLMLFGASAGDRSSRKTSTGSVPGLPVRPIVAAGLVGMFVLLAGAVVMTVGLGGSEPDATQPESRHPASTVPGPPRSSQPDGRPSIPSPAPTPAQAVSDPAGLPILAVRASDPERFGPEATADALQPESVVRVHATGFDEFETGWVEQCFGGLGRPVSCDRPFPVQFGVNGATDFQYLLRSSLAPGGCRSGTSTCTLRVTGTSSGRQGVIRTLFLDRATSARIDVEPSTGVTDGEAVVVTVTGFPPNAGLTATLCAPPRGYDTRRCAAEGATDGFRADAGGSGRTSLVVRSGPLGTDRVMCGPRDPCGVAVVTDDGFEAAPVVPLGFSRGPGAGYDPWRLAGGLAFAATLGAVAVIVARTTDWTKPSEAATPEVDGADLQTGSSLDDLFGTDEELEERYPAEL